MGMLLKEANEYNRIKREEIERGGNIAITEYEIGKEAIQEYKLNGQVKDTKAEIKEVTQAMLQDIKEQIVGRPTIGDETKISEEIDEGR